MGTDFVLARAQKPQSPPPARRSRCFDFGDRQSTSPRVSLPRAQFRWKGRVRYSQRPDSAHRSKPKKCPPSAFTLAGASACPFDCGKGRLGVLPRIPNKAITRALNSLGAALDAPRWPALGTSHKVMSAGSRARIISGCCGRILLSASLWMTRIGTWLPDPSGEAYARFAPHLSLPRISTNPAAGRTAVPPSWLPAWDTYSTRFSAIWRKLANGDSATTTREKVC